MKFLVVENAGDLLFFFRPLGEKPDPLSFGIRIGVVDNFFKLLLVLLDMALLLYFHTSQYQDIRSVFSPVPSF